MSKNSFFKINNNLAENEKLLFSKAIDQAFLCTRDNKNKFTDFINLGKHEDFIDKLKKEFDINVSCFGGVEESERQLIGFSPPYYELENSEFPIESIEIKYNKFSKEIKHRDLLGAILGTGVDRDRIGDILIFDTRAIVFVDSSMANHICANLVSVGSNKVEVSIKQVEDLYMPLSQYQDMRVTVTSVRVCSIISAVFNMSRSKSADLIKGKKVFINWERVNNSSKTLKSKDTITVRGYGRIYIDEISGKSSKDKFILNVHKYG